MPSSEGFVDVPVSEFSFLINAKSSNPEAEDGSDGDNSEGLPGKCSPSMLGFSAPTDRLKK